MKKFFKILLEVIVEAFYGFIYFIKSNLIVFANIINLCVPYLMYFIGQYVAGNKIKMGIELVIPLLFSTLTYCFKAVANKYNKGITVPVPEKRFTQIDDDGEVSIENSRVQELILYMADLEEWMEKRGLL